ncbi:hypothetical protein TRM7615_01138 [Falsiruegeria mediterranea M17]|uniref:HTH cro/C1-type domain-containing protein n=2 Tax=Falsiruegeria TaxID=2854184 RepID=A0A2R8C5E8_9RHOB|nr:hypothetical protein TRM7615_01138 [Falsiruegeria mediterranea M17]
MYSDMDISNRLKQARMEAGFRSAQEAADRFGWTASTYAAHENGTRGMKPDAIERYAKAFRSDPCFIAFGTQNSKPSIAGVSDRVLREVIQLIMEHDGARDAAPSEIADLIIDLCHYAKQSGGTGLSNIVDFAFARHAGKAG